MTTIDNIQEAATHIGSKLKPRPAVAVVLGSGLGGFADALSQPISFPFDEIPHFPRSSVEGHKGRLIAGTFAGGPLFAMAGRVHAYEGYSAQDVVFPVRVLATLGVRTVLLTNAAGAVNTAFKPGELMIITDHLNLTGRNPLVGPELPDLGHRFTDLSMAYDPKLVETCEQAGRRIGLHLRQGVYAGFLGPSFETPAEIRMVRTLGADAVGMSTVLETIACNQMGVRVLGMSCVTNMAAGVLPQKINHQEVIEIGRRIQSVFVELMESFLPSVYKQS